MLFSYLKNTPISFAIDLIIAFDLELICEKCFSKNKKKNY